MTDPGIFSGLAVAHLWQSVAVAAVLAAALIFGRKLAGSTRYGLSAAAFTAALLLPMAAFIPGESILRSALQAIDAPVSVRTQAEVDALHAEQAKKPFWAEAARKDGAPEWAVSFGEKVVAAATKPADAKAGEASPTVIEKIATDNGAPAPIARALSGLLETAAPPPPPKPAFTLPQIDLPQLPNLALPLIAVWIAGALLLLVRTGRDLVAVERLVRRAQPVDLPPALKERMRGVRVAISAEAPGPMAAGLFHPVVVLPETSAKQLNSPGMAALLEHERAHIERRDMAVALVQRVILALLWWSPALHWISRRIDEERELACDEQAVARTGDARAFARSLTTQAENQLWARAPRLAVGAIGPRSQFGRRIKRLIDIAKSGATRSKYSGRLAFSVLAVTIVAAALVTPRIIAQPSPPPVESSLAGGPRENQRLADLDVKVDEQALRQSIKDDDLDGALAGLGPELAGLMDGVAQEIAIALGDSPELQGELSGLAAELSALGLEIGAAIDEELANELPGIMDEVREALQEVDESQWDQEFDKEEFRQDMEELRRELRDQFGPQFREELRRELQDARREVEAHRHEWRAEREHSMAIAKEAIAEARKEIAEARARGDFDIHVNRGDADWAKDSAKWAEFGAKFGSAWGSQQGNRDAVRARASSDERRLFVAASRGDEEKVRELLKQGVDPNKVFPGDGTALIAAAREGEVEVVRALLDGGADPNKASRGDGNPLIAAASEGEQDIVELLLARGADPNAYVEDDETPLINAAREGEEDIVKLLVARGADVNRAYRADGEVRSPLNMAERHGNDDVAAYLRSRGAVRDPKPVN